MLHLEGFEYRSCSGNLWLQERPESIVTSTYTTLSQVLVPAIPIKQLEFDRIDLAVGHRKSDGPLWDIIIKFTYYRMKETLLSAVQYKPDLSFQGYSYQLFEDLSPINIQKCRQLNTFTPGLLNWQIKPNVIFPFKLAFDYQDRSTPWAPRKRPTPHLRPCTFSPQAMVLLAQWIPPPPDPQPNVWDICGKRQWGTNTPFHTPHHVCFSFPVPWITS